MRTSDDDVILRELCIGVCPDCRWLRDELEAKEREVHEHAGFTAQFAERCKAKVRRWQVAAAWGWGTAALMFWVWLRFR